jgi:hypothetical protein
MRFFRSALLLLVLTGAGCSSGDPPEPSPGSEGDSGSTEATVAAPSDIPVRLRGTLTFTSHKSFTQGSPRRGASYSHNTAVNCEFTQAAVTWTDPQSGIAYFRLAESEPGVLTSEASGTAQASGDGRVIDLEHEPEFSESSTVRLGGPITLCKIRRLDESQFGTGYDIEIEFQAALTGSVRTVTQNGDTIMETQSGGTAMPMGIVPVPADAEGMYAIENEPANTSKHLGASPLLMRPDLGARPEGSGPEVELQQQIYDGLVAHRNMAWVGLQFDPVQRVWTFEGAHRTGAGEDHSLRVRIAVEQ